ncbi:hypothetical protein [Candidatus Puniceispirillum marinum]|nr:hypothetical protein [Candidatus Puniceispirillum marinum]
MYAKIYQYKFANVNEAKVAAAFCSDYLGGKIAEYKFQAINVAIGKGGDLSILIKFEDINKLKKYEEKAQSFINELKGSFVFKENHFAGVFVLNYEAEASARELKMSGPVKVLDESNA